MSTYDTKPCIYFIFIVIIILSIELFYLYCITVAVVKSLNIIYYLKMYIGPVVYLKKHCQIFNSKNIKEIFLF